MHFIEFGGKVVFRGRINRLGKVFVGKSNQNFWWRRMDQRDHWGRRREGDELSTSGRKRRRNQSCKNRREKQFSACHAPTRLSGAKSALRHEKTITEKETLGTLLAIVVVSPFIASFLVVSEYNTYSSSSIWSYRETKTFVFSLISFLCRKKQWQSSSGPLSPLGTLVSRRTGTFMSLTSGQFTRRTLSRKKEIPKIPDDYFASLLPSPKTGALFSANAHK